VLAGPYLSVDPGMGASILISCLIVVVVGGLGSIGGAIAAAVVYGFIQVIGTVLFPSLAVLAPYLLLFVVLLWRPQGFGRGRWPDERRRCAAFHGKLADACAGRSLGRLVALVALAPGGRDRGLRAQGRDESVLPQPGDQRHDPRRRRGRHRFPDAPVRSGDVRRRRVHRSAGLLVGLASAQLGLG
jgi:hypothetical protein